MKMLKPIVLGLISLFFGMWLVDISTGWWMLIGLVFVLTGFVTPIVAYIRHDQELVWELYQERRTVELLFDRLSEESGETPMWWKRVLASAKNSQDDEQSLADAFEGVLKSDALDDIERTKKLE